jgi:hypothetical protein
MTTRTSAASRFSELKARIDTREARVGMMGLRDSGLPLALLYTEAKSRSTHPLVVDTCNTIRGIPGENIVRSDFER